MGVNSTPTIYINGRAVIGAQPFEVFKSIIDEELAKKYVQGIKTIFPLAPASMTITCARAASDRGSSTPTTGESAPVASPAPIALMCARDLVWRDAPQRHPEDRAILRHDLARIDLHSSAIADDDDAAAGRDGAEIVIEVHVGQHLDDQIGTAAGGQRRDLAEVPVLAMIHHVVRALFLDQRRVRRRSRPCR